MGFSPCGTWLNWRGTKGRATQKENQADLGKQSQLERSLRNSDVIWFKRLPQSLRSLAMTNRGC